MKTFTKVVLLDNTGLRDWAIDQCGKLSKEKVTVYADVPQSEMETIKRIGSADCVLVSPRTRISKLILEQCPNIKYVGMCCSLYSPASANVDILTAQSLNIEVRGVRDYGDEGVIEFIISELIRLLKGLGNHQWREEPVELGNRKLGIIGMGTTGTMLAEKSFAFGMNVYYYSRNRNTRAEQLGAIYLPLDELLTTVDIISTHLPRHTVLLGKDQFAKLGNGKILINSSLGLTFDKQSFLDWIHYDGNFAIFDSDGCGPDREEFKGVPRIITTPRVAGRTAESRERLSQKVIDNLVSYLQTANK